MFDKLIDVCVSSSAAFRIFRLVDENPLSGTKKSRMICAPNDEMRKIHNWIIAYLDLLVVDLPFATACRRGNSPRRNVERHQMNVHFYLTDLEDAYPSVDGLRLADILAKLDQLPYGENSVQRILEFLTRFCLLPSGGLVIGAPASPALFNIYSGMLLDEPLGQLCTQWGITYTRYLDDLTFSAPEGNPIGEKKRRMIREVIAKVGFKANHRRSKVYDLRKGAIVINGVGLEYGGRILCPRRYCKKIKGAVHSGIKKQNVSQKTVAGMMGVFYDLTRGRRMNRTERKLVQLVRSFCVPSGRTLSSHPQRKREWWEKF